MNCPDAKQRLSAYFDGQLPEAERAAIAAHLEQCAACREELAGIARLSELTRSLHEPEVPRGLWTKIESQLATAGGSAYAPLAPAEVETAPLPEPAASTAPPSPAEARFAGRSPRFGPWRLLAMAAGLLLVVGAGVFALRHWPPGEPHGATSDVLVQYVHRLETDPAAAQSFLLAHYRGQPASLDEAARRLRYRPAVAAGLPPEWQLEEVYVLEMPCCRCPQAVCRCADGRHVAVFEHTDEQPHWFGKRPTIRCHSDGVPLLVTQLNGRLAATWKQDGRYVTVVGADDLADVQQFVRHLRRPPPAPS